jgi:hypothetical protein
MAAVGARRASGPIDREHHVARDWNSRDSAIIDIPTEPTCVSVRGHACDRSLSARLGDEVSITPIALAESVSDSSSSSVWRAHHGTERRLGDLAGRGGDILDRDHRPDGILDPVVGDRGDVDADVVLGDDPLGLDRQRDDTPGDAIDPLDQREGEDQPRSRRRARAGRPPRACPVIFPSLNTTARSYCLMT